MGELAEAALQRHVAAAPRIGVALVGDVPSAAPATADPDRVLQTLSN